MHLECTKGGYRLRMVVPEKLRLIVGRSQLRYNIPAASRQEAEVVASRVIQRLKTLFIELETGELMAESIDVPALVPYYVATDKRALKALRTITNILTLMSVCSRFGMVISALEHVRDCKYITEHEDWRGLSDYVSSTMHQALGYRF